MPGIPLSYVSLLLLKKPPKQRVLRLMPWIMACFALLMVFGVYLVIQWSSPKNRIISIKSMHPEFIGRKEYFKKIGKLCNQKGKSTVSVIVLWGENWVGKTEIALTFANRNVDKFNLIFQIDASTKKDYESSYRGLAEKLGIQLEHQISVDECVKKVHQLLEEKHQPWLLIYDHVEIPVELPKKGAGTIILTTQDQTLWMDHHCLNVGPLSLEESVHLFATITREKEGPYRLPLINEVGYFPAALSAVAHHIADTGKTEQEYLQSLNKNNANLIEVFKNKEQLVDVWECTAHRLYNKHSKTLEWLHFCSYLNPNGISREWLEEWLRISDPFERKLKSDEVLRDIVNEALVSYNEKSRSIHLHRLKQELFKQDSYFNSEMQDQVLQFLLHHTSVSDWSFHAKWFFDHYAHLLSQEQAVKLQELLNKNGTKHPVLHGFNKACS